MQPESSADRSTENAFQSGPFAGLNIVDVSGTVATSYACKLFAG